MAKKIKILLALSFVAILAVSYLIITSKPVNNVGKQANKEQVKVDLKKLEEEYKAGTKNILTDYSALLLNNDLNLEKVEADKNKLLGLKVPAEFKDLHLNFVLAVSKMEDYLKNGKDEDKAASQRMISEIKANYVWLN
jgi:hypothetical protein